MIDPRLLFSSKLLELKRSLGVRRVSIQKGLDSAKTSSWRVRYRGEVCAKIIHYKYLQASSGVRFVRNER